MNRLLALFFVLYLLAEWLSYQEEDAASVARYGRGYYAEMGESHT